MSEPAPTSRRHVKQFRSSIVEQRCAALVQQAARLMLANGCDRVRVEDVADASGVAKGTCYQHFKSKTDMLAAAQECLDRRMAERLARIAAESGPQQSLLAAADGIIANLIRRLAGDGKPPMSDEVGWACCLKFTTCPVGGPARSVDTLHRAVSATGGRHAPLPAEMAVDLVLAVPAVQVAERMRRRREPPAVRLIRAAVSRALGGLFPENPTGGAAVPVRRSRSRG